MKMSENKNEEWDEYHERRIAREIETVNILI